MTHTHRAPPSVAGPSVLDGFLSETETLLLLSLSVRVVHGRFSQGLRWIGHGIPRTAFSEDIVFSVTDEVHFPFYQQHTILYPQRGYEI